jgi:hypothetical protein
MPGKKSSKFDNEGIESLAKDKPVVYTIEDNKRKPLYVWCRKEGARGSAFERASAKRI